ncbi:LON peptidase substrate-binding domain-containing protein [Enterovirga sp.]|jgi:Lon protease-like protein|uniref:LON peptidase substrate-binding domain-containing protein n=1 Tax=Enterovirga sp. TaxID=2026350 RepID=UPI00261CA0B5|nr:LON peptidase substrate-binding domain-containing protein [Enterovirga sp.]MDB5589948.1 peptidase lon domain protein [Enterovirga sp.]
MNVVYEGPQDLPDAIPVFPLTGALLLPRGQMPLNIFEPRYVQMVDAALRGSRLIGMVQPEAGQEGSAAPRLHRVGCVGRLVQFAETGDGRYIVSLAGVARFAIEAELPVTTPFRQCRVTFAPYAADFKPRLGENEVDRNAVLAALLRFTEATGLKIDWTGIEKAPNEALVNALSMMAPFGPREKQALLEAPDLRSRAETLVAITEMELAKTDPGSQTTLQ